MTSQACKDDCPECMTAGSAHVVFGTLLSFAFFSSGVRRQERLFTQTA